MHEKQVLSNTVSNLIKYYEDPCMTETQRFVHLFDKFFDCLNVRDLNQWRIKKKTDLKPYYSRNDERLKVNIATLKSTLL